MWDVLWWSLAVSVLSATAAGVAALFGGDPVTAAATLVGTLCVGWAAEAIFSKGRRVPPRQVYDPNIRSTRPATQDELDKARKE